MELWRKVWRNGICPYLSPASLLALREGIIKDDPALVQGITVSPPSVDVFALEPVVAADAIGYAAWQAHEKRTVHELMNHWENVRALAEMAMGEAGCVRFFLNWFDECPRDEMRRQLLAEINVALATKAVA